MKINDAIVNRMLDEEKELEQRIKKATSFSLREFGELSRHAYELLLIQIDVMVTYKGILQKRIKLYKQEHE